MLLEEFSFGNAWSFKDINTLNMSAANIQSQPSKVDFENVIDHPGGLKTLKTKAIYGANASGKSNVFKALNFFIDVIGQSHRDNSTLSKLNKFALSKLSEIQPSYFQTIFSTENVRYRYGFDVTDGVITAEWLFARFNKRETQLFVREREKVSGISVKYFHEATVFQKLAGSDSTGTKIYRDDALVISTLATFGFAKVSKLLYESLSSIKIINDSLGYRRFDQVIEAMDDEKTKSFIVNMLKYADLSINEISVYIAKSHEGTKTSESKHLTVYKPVYNEDHVKVGRALFFMSLDESEGTKKMVELSLSIYQVITNGGVLVIDEFDSKLHPSLTKRIVQLFNSPSNHKAQLIFTTQDTNLLSNDLLRRDQIDFVEKDKYGGSHLYTLVEFKGIRNSASFEKDYLQGKYGAIPFLGNFETIINNSKDAEGN